MFLNQAITYSPRGSTVLIQLFEQDYTLIPSPFLTKKLNSVNPSTGSMSNNFGSIGNMGMLSSRGRIGSHGSIGSTGRKWSGASKISGGMDGSNGNIGIGLNGGNGGNRSFNNNGNKNNTNTNTNDTAKNLMRVKAVHNNYSYNKHTDTKRRMCDVTLKVIDQGTALLTSKPLLTALSVPLRPQLTSSHYLLFAFSQSNLCTCTCMCTYVYTYISMCVRTLTRIYTSHHN